MFYALGNRVQHTRAALGEQEGKTERLEFREGHVGAKALFVKFWVDDTATRKLFGSRGPQTSLWEAGKTTHGRHSDAYAANSEACDAQNCWPTQRNKFGCRRIDGELGQSGPCCIGKMLATIYQPIWPIRLRIIAL
jgi:hypothetical protein